MRSAFNCDRDRSETMKTLLKLAKREMRKYYNDNSRVSSTKKSERERVQSETVVAERATEPSGTALSSPVQLARERQTSGQTGSQFPNIARNARAAAPLRMSPRFTNSGIFRFPYPYKADELIV